MQIDVAYFDYCDLSSSEPRYLGAQRYEMPVELYASAPKSDGSTREPNPLNLGLYSALGYEGSLVMSSAQVFTTPQTGRNVVLTYWRLQQDGSDLSGVLTDSHVAEAAAMTRLSSGSNLVACQPQMGSFPNEYAIAPGATIEGTLTAEEADLVIQGGSTDGMRAFRASVAVQR